MAGSVFIVYGDHIETPLARRRHLPQKIASHKRQFSLFIAVHSGLSGLEVPFGASLDLDKTQDIPVPADQIQFAAMIGRAKISRNDRITPPTKIEVGIFFAPTARPQVFSRVVRWKEPRGQRVKDA